MKRYKTRCTNACTNYATIFCLHACSLTCQWNNQLEIAPPFGIAPPYHTSQLKSATGGGQWMVVMAVLLWEDNASCQTRSKIPQQSFVWLGRWQQWHLTPIEPCPAHVASSCMSECKGPARQETSSYFQTHPISIIEEKVLPWKTKSNLVALPWRSEHPYIISELQPTE